jgi:LacI family transcriptional regulator
MDTVGFFCYDFIMSIVQIAKIAGVSHTTVARVVNSPDLVGVETVQKVRKIMEDIGYTPKPQYLRRGPKKNPSKIFKTGNVAFLTSAEGFHFLGYSPVIMNVVRGIDETLASYGLSMVQGVVNSKRQLPPIIAKGGVDGVIIWPDLGHVSKECLNTLKDYQCVYVMTGREKYLAGDRVLNNHEKIGAIAADYLASRGHKDLLYIDYDKYRRLRTSWIERWYGFEEAAVGCKTEKLLLDINSSQILHTKDFDHDQVLASLQKKLLGADRATGIFSSSDSLTATLYPFLRKIGIKIGRDVEIISCNSEKSILTGLDPCPESIDIRPEEIGRIAVEQLRLRLLNPEDTNKHIIEVQPRLVLNKGN